MISTKNTKNHEGKELILGDECYTASWNGENMSISSSTKGTKWTQRVLRVFFVSFVDEIFSGEPGNWLRVRCQAKTL
jgi:hypothetical protein